MAEGTKYVYQITVSGLQEQGNSFNQDGEGFALPCNIAEDMIRQQQSDKAVTYLRNGLESKVLSNEHTLIIGSPEEKPYVLKRDSFVLDSKRVIWR